MSKGQTLNEQIAGNKLLFKYSFDVAVATAVVALAVDFAAVVGTTEEKLHWRSYRTQQSSGVLV